MNNVNKTLYIPLYGKAYVSRKNRILHDKKAEEIWAQTAFPLKGKSKSKWLAYYMSMRAAVYDEWVEQEIRKSPNAVVLHVGCGLDGRCERVLEKAEQWYDIDFPEVIEERSKYYKESAYYRMIPADMRTEEWKQYIDEKKDAIIILEGVSMYFRPEELKKLLSGFSSYFNKISILLDCYTERAAKASKYKNPINDVGVTQVYGYDNPQELAETSGFVYVKEHDMTPQKYIAELQGMERKIFKKLYSGKIAKSLYRMYELKKSVKV